MDKTRLAEKRHRDIQNTEDYKYYNNQLQKTKLQKKKQYESNKKEL